MEVQDNEDPREVLNWFLTRADEEIERARNREAVWGPSAEAVTVLEQITAARKYLDQAERGAVALLREEGASWRHIGTFLGVTAQAAQQRFGKAKLYRVPGAPALPRYSAPDDLRACCDHPAHEPGKCQFMRIVGNPPASARCNCDGWCPTADG